MPADVREVDRGWDRLRSIIKLIARADQPYVKVGVLDDGKGADAHGNLTTAGLAALHNYGSEDGRIPARPFITGTWEKYRAVYMAKLALLVQRIYEGQLTYETVLNVMGSMIASDMKREVTTGENFLPNAESTIKAKGSSRPLIDTARMIGALSWAVVSNGKTGGT